MTYKEQLKDRRWQIKRNKILERDNYTCQNTKCPCRDDNSKLLQVHHLDYLGDKMAWDYPDDMLLTLCEDCHKDENNRPKEEKYLINTLRMKGFLIGDLLAHSALMETDASFTANLLRILREFQNK